MVIIFRQRFSLYLEFVILILEFRANLAEVKSNGTNCTELLNFSDNCTDILNSIEETAKLETDLKKSICNIFDGFNIFFKKLIGSKAVFNSLNQTYVRNVLSTLKSVNGITALNISTAGLDNVNASLPEGIKDLSFGNNKTLNTSSGLLKSDDIKKLSNISGELFNLNPDKKKQAGSTTPLPHTTTGSKLMKDRTFSTGTSSLISSGPISDVKISSKSVFGTTPISNSVKLASSLSTATVASISSEPRSTIKAIFIPSSSFRTSTVTFSDKSTPFSGAIQPASTTLPGGTVHQNNTITSGGGRPPGGFTVSPNTLFPGDIASKVVSSTLGSPIISIKTLTPIAGTSLSAGSIPSKNMPPSGTSSVDNTLLSAGSSPMANIIVPESTPSQLLTTLSYAVTISFTNTTNDPISQNVSQNPLENYSLLGNDSLPGRKGGHNKPKSGSVVFINQLLANASRNPLIGNKTIELRIAINSKIAQRNKRKIMNETTNDTNGSTQNMSSEELTTMQGDSASDLKTTDLDQETSSQKNTEDWNRSTEFLEGQTKQIAQDQSFKSHESATDWKVSTYSYNKRDLKEDFATRITENATNTPEKFVREESLPLETKNTSFQRTTNAFQHSSKLITSPVSWENLATNSASLTLPEVNTCINQLWAGLGNISVSTAYSTTQNELVPLSLDTKIVDNQSNSAILESRETTPVQSSYISNEKRSKDIENSPTLKATDETECPNKLADFDLTKSIESSTIRVSEIEIMRNHSLPTNMFVTAIPGAIVSSNITAFTTQDHTITLTTVDQIKLSSIPTTSPGCIYLDRHLTPVNMIPKQNENDHLNELITTKYTDKRYSDKQSMLDINKNNIKERMIKREQIRFSKFDVAGNDHKDYQYVVSMHDRISKAYISTGVVITKSHILTSAAALYNANATPLKSQDLIVRIRPSNTDGSNIGKEIHISAIFIHPRYEMMRNNYTKHDLAVLLTDELMETPVIPLATENEDVLPGNCIVLGWGKTGYVDDSQMRNNLLIESKVTLSSSKQCKAMIPDFEETSSYCTIRKELLLGPCNNDRGSPLICSNQLYGIVTLNGNCGHSNNPQIFTRLSNYADFIEDKIKLILTSVKKSMSQIQSIEFDRFDGKLKSRGAIQKANLYIIIHSVIYFLLPKLNL